MTQQSAQQNGHILTVKLPDRQRARLWLPAATNGVLPAIGSVLYVATEPRPRSTTLGEWPAASLKAIPVLRHWQSIESDFSLPYLQTLLQKTPLPQALIRFLALMARLQDQRLKQFLKALFGQSDIALPFITLPASFRHHHSMPGGLLLHSVECAEWLESIAQLTLSQAEAELTIVTALLHDLGKIRTMTQPDAGHLVSHEVMSLALVEPCLNQLQPQWKQGANALRQMLSWPLDSMKYPKLPGVLLVKMADQYSTALSARSMAFAGQPDYFYWASLKTSTSIQFFNRIL